MKKKSKVGGFDLGLVGEPQHPLLLCFFFLQIHDNLAVTFIVDETKNQNRNWHGILCNYLSFTFTGFFLRARKKSLRRLNCS